jgi:hypothetical protein
LKITFKPDVFLFNPTNFELSNFFRPPQNSEKPNYFFFSKQYSENFLLLFYTPKSSNQIVHMNISRRSQEGFRGELPASLTKNLFEKSCCSESYPCACEMEHGKITEAVKKKIRETMFQVTEQEDGSWKEHILG